ncbi:probable glutathione S-transferase GSTU6 [Aegilops tauschii subsp. strangulata]|uniref:Glutathione S-transferase n=2 Tax=Aegilops tauschii TaxID=37682 RepID=A0A453QH29_AEGTS|nr:probable glutathione S-transferase GSTU6 [Aegilops tauschii subsp. strangulata]
MAAAGAGGDDLKLLGMWASPAVLRVRLALSIKGVSSYEYQEEDFDNKSELLLRSNPVHKMVPVLIHAGKPVCESTVIIQYLDEAFAGDGRPALLPADPYERAVARFWAAFIDDTLLKAMYQASWSKTEEEKVEGKKKVAAALKTLDGALRDVAGGKPFFGGDAPGYVDTVLGGLLAWARSMDVINGVKTIDPVTMPLLAAWADRFGALDAVEAVMPDVNRLVEFSLSLTT